MVEFGTSDKKKSLLYSMLTLAGLVGAAVIVTTIVTSYLRAQDPVNQCITNPSQQPFQVSVPLTVSLDRFPASARQVGISADCIRPVHSYDDGVIRVAYERPYDFTLGHFFYYWLGDSILDYEVKVLVDGESYDGDFRDIVLRQGDAIEIELTTRNR